MKQLKYILLFAVALSSLSATAQRRFDASVFGGASFNQIDGDSDGGYAMLGLRGGVGTSFYLGTDERSPWRMVVELAYTMKGSNIDNSMLQRRIALNYVEMPLMMSYTLMNGTLRLSAGVAPAVLVGARVSDDGVENTAQEENYKQFDWCPLTVGARYLFSYDIAVEVRFQTSMLSVTEENSTGTYRLFKSNKGAFNRGVYVGLAYCF